MPGRQGQRRANIHTQANTQTLVLPQCFLALPDSAVQGSVQGAPPDHSPCQALAQNTGDPHCSSGQQAPSTPDWQAGSQQAPTERGASARINSLLG